DDVAEDDVMHVVGADAGTRGRFAQDHRGELRRGEILQASAEVPDGGAHAGDDDDFTVRCIHFFRPAWWFRKRWGLVSSGLGPTRVARAASGPVSESRL